MKFSVELRRHGIYTATGASCNKAEYLSDDELAQIIAYAYEGIICHACHHRGPGGRASCYPAEYWGYYYPRAVLVIMVGEFHPEEA